MAKEKTSKKNKHIELISLFICISVVILLWDTYFVYPIKLFVVLLHELSHAFITFVTGGTVKEISIGFDLGGKLTADGGNEIAISTAGYIGSLIIGLLLFISAEYRRYGKYLFFILAAIILLTLLNSNPTLIFSLLCILISGLLVVFGLFIHNRFITLFVKAIALSSALYVLIDIKEDMFAKFLSSDAAILSSLTGLNSTLISIFWLAVSSFTIFILIRIVYFKKKR